MTNSTPAPDSFVEPRGPGGCFTVGFFKPWVFLGGRGLEGWMVGGGNGWIGKWIGKWLDREMDREMVCSFDFCCLKKIYHTS